MLHALTEKDASETASQSAAHPQAGGARPQRYTPLQLLSTLKKHSIADEPQLNFDYITFLESCFSLMTSIISSARCNMPRDSKVHQIEVGYELVDYLLWDAAEALTSGHPSQTTAIKHAAATIQGFIQTDGKRFSKEAFDQSSGRIPEHKRHNFAKRTESTAAA